jgi:hypothetical protein
MFLDSEGKLGYCMIGVIAAEHEGGEDPDETVAVVSCELISCLRCDHCSP